MGGATSRSARALLLAAALAALASRAEAQDLTGRWSYTENGQTAELDIRHDRATGRVTGTLSLFGAALPVEGRAGAGDLVIETLAGVPVGMMGEMTGRLERSALLFTVAENGAAPVTMRMTREGGAPGPAPVAEAAPAAGAEEFAGEWQQANDDQTQGEVVRLTARGGTVEGTITAMERGYYSGQVSVVREVRLRGTVRGGTLEFRAWDAAGGPESGVSGTAHRRGEYLVLRVGEGETGYARPGTPLVRSAEGSAEAAALARAVSGKVYSSGSQAGGRGAFVGGRVRLALCSDGRIEYDASDLASTPGALPGSGVELGSSVARRGSWSVVLVAGAPAVRAEWNGTGSSYSLTAYFRVVPAADGRRAVVDGVELPATGRC